MKIITLVRDPIGFEVSNFFQNIKCFYADLIDDNGRINQDKALNFLYDKIKKYNAKTAHINTWLLKLSATLMFSSILLMPIKAFVLFRKKI